jgi:hypothetical protein
MHPSILPPMTSTLSNGSLLIAQSGCHLYFPRLPFSSAFGPPLTPFSHTSSLPSPLSFKPPALVYLLPRSLFLSLKTQHSFLLALNKLMGICGDFTYHLLSPPPAHLTYPLQPHSSQPPPSTPLLHPSIFNLKDAAFATYVSQSIGSRGYITIHGLTTKLLLRNPPQSLFTALGHLDVVRKNLRSSKSPPFQTSLPCTCFSYFVRSPHLIRLPPIHLYCFPRRFCGFRPHWSVSRDISSRKQIYLNHNLPRLYPLHTPKI